MKLRLAFFAGLLSGILLAAAFLKPCKRDSAQPVDTFADKMMQRTEKLNKELVKIKQARQDDNRTRRLSQ